MRQQSACNVWRWVLLAALLIAVVIGLTPAIALAEEDVAVLQEATTSDAGEVDSFDDNAAIGQEDVSFEEADVAETVLEDGDEDVVVDDQSVEVLADDVDDAALAIAGTTDQDATTYTAIRTTRRSLTSARVSRIRKHDFTGKAIKPDPMVKVGRTVLKRNRDYTITYKRNIWPGTAKLFIKGKGKWKGTIKKTFTIRAKYVMVGDSYAMTSPHPWPARIAARLGLKKPQWSELVGGEGYGFHGYICWTHLIHPVKRDVHVSHVVIVGSAGNDVHCTDQEIRDGYRKTINALRKKYPNARIVHAVPNWMMGNGHYIRTVTRRYSLYKKLAKKHGVYYLPSCQRIFEGRYDCLNGDGNHPNDRGADIIAKTVIRDMKKKGIV